MLYDSHYFQNCKPIIFRKITNQTKCKKPNVPSHLYIFRLNFDKANHSFLHPFLLLKGKDFQNIFCLGFWVGNQCIFSECEHHKFNFFPHMVKYTSQRKFNRYSGERQCPKEFKDIGKDVSLRLILWRTRVVSNTVYHFVSCNMGVEIFLKKREHHKKGALK